jgi:hypothetical protein
MSTGYNVPMTWALRWLAMAMSINMCSFDRSGPTTSGIVYVPMPDWDAEFLIVVSLEQKSAFADLIVDHLLALIVLLEHREELHDVRILQARLSERHYEEECAHTSPSN